MIIAIYFLCSHSYFAGKPRVSRMWLQVCAVRVCGVCVRVLRALCPCSLSLSLCLSLCARASVQPQGVLHSFFSSHAGVIDFPLTLCKHTHEHTHLTRHIWSYQRLWTRRLILLFCSIRTLKTGGEKKKERRDTTVTLHKLIGPGFFLSENT